jgi:1,4-alpha-glucan branching enzyme
LADDANLRYKFLLNFEKAMLGLASRDGLWTGSGNFISRKDECDKVIGFELGGLLFLFNFHPTKSFVHYRVGYAAARTGIEFLKIVLSSDDKEFGGYDRIDKTVNYYLQPIKWDNRGASLQVYLPSRTCLVLAAAEAK